MSGIHLSGFELIEKIGEGGMGQVWKARQLSLDRIVAIKLLSERYSKDPESVRQIFQEARTAAKLKHPGIVQVYDASEENGSFYFVMEYVDGWNVGQWIKRKRVLSTTDALVVVESVVEALDYAWRTAGLIHCDIKPENLMVEKDGTIKVADLGLSLTRDSDMAEPTDEVAGTPGYISPEQVQGEANLDCRTDIYAMGCCLYQMVTGRRPFNELPDEDAMLAQITQQIPDPRDHVPGIPHAVCCLIERMLVKDRDKRLKDWSVVRTELHRVQNKQLPSGPHPENFESTMRRNPTVEKAEKGEVRKRVNVQASVPLTRGNAPVPAPEKRSYGMLLILLLLAAAAVAVFFYTKKLEREKEAALPKDPTLTGGSGAMAPAGVSAPAGGVGASGQGGGHSVRRPRAPTPAREAPSLASTLAEINRTAADYEANGLYDDGIRWLEQYSGNYVKETQSNRVALAMGLRRYVGDRQEEADWQALLKDLTVSLISGKYKSARDRVETVLKDVKLRKHRDELVGVADILGGITKLNDKLLETFAKDKGKIVRIRMSRGEFTGQILEIRDRMVVCKATDLAAQVNIRLEDLSMDERMSRLLPMGLAELFLVRGVTAFSEKRYDEALSDLGKTGPVLSPLLTRAVQEIMGKEHQEQLASDPSCMAFTTVMSQAGINPVPFDPVRWRKEIDERSLTPEMAATVERAMEEFLRTHGGSVFATTHAELLLALQKVCGKAIKPEPGPAAAEAPQDTAEQ
jgi:serine/threonine-protein kinase